MENRTSYGREWRHMFLLTLTMGDSIREYHAIIEPDLAGTGRYGLTLSLDGGEFGSGGWMKIEQIQASP